MERAAWTDERLDDLAEGMRSGFSRLDQDLRDVRAEIGGLRVETREEIGGLRGEMREEFRGVRSEIEGLRQTMIRIGGAMMIGFVSLLGAIIARGV